MRHLFYMILFQFIVATPQINLYFSDDNDNMIEHDCLRVTTFKNESNHSRQILSYCISESLSKYNIQNPDQFQMSTFTQLAKQNITCQQLYLWSAPIDIIEDYQFYLNHLSISNSTVLASTIFYNCTLPRFGSKCQYEFDYYHTDHSSLNELIYNFYQRYIDNSTTMTCYIHLACNRGLFSSCLDWSEICDGKIDCLNDEIDEHYCWQLEINACNDNEYRCTNGQCILKSFYGDDNDTPDCLDQSDEHRDIDRVREKCDRSEPAFGCEDIICIDMPLTSSCRYDRTKLLIDAMFSIKDKSMPAECWSALKSITNMFSSYVSTCYELYPNEIDVDIIEQWCPDMIMISTVPVLFNEIYFAYSKNDIPYVDCESSPSVCYNNNSLYDEYFIDSTKTMINNLSCYCIEDYLLAGYERISVLENYLIPLYMGLKKYSLISKYMYGNCNRSNMYQCVHSSKCISIHRLMDRINDCPYNDDENINKSNNIDLMERIEKTRFKCQVFDKYIPQSLVLNGICDCGYIENGWCEDEHFDITYARRSISFQTICDGHIELLPIIIDGEQHTDETECQHWLCNNIYTHCDGIWQCLNGIDELDCYSSSPINCSLDQHVCVSRYTNQLQCLPLNKANDGIIDCIGATDESHLCYRNTRLEHSNNFFCINSTSRFCIPDYFLCNGINDCDSGDDEQFCNRNHSRSEGDTICDPYYSSIRLDIEQFLCQSSKLKKKRQIIYFSLNGNRRQNIDETNLSPLPFIDKNREEKESHCHRGLDLQLWIDHKNDLTRIICLCPPSYYGDQCQYQNERISLSLQFRTSSDSWQIPFSIIITLIDNSYERIIHSYEQFTYLSIRDCQMKFNIYLFYSTKPKDQTKIYSIHIDIYDKLLLNYRASYLFPIKFPFLPVHRLTFILDIPPENHIIESCSHLECSHGKCVKYSNNPENLSFCQCDRGWSGQYCNISYDCRCSFDSLCLGITNYNRSICICPLHRFGPRCLIHDFICQNQGNLTCFNGGQCMPNDEYITSDQKYTCICPKGFTGKRCELVENKILITFNKNILLSQSIFIHFIQVMTNEQPRRSTTFQTLPFKQNSISIYWSQPFHLVFIEFSKKNYYFTVLQKNYTQSRSLEKTIDLSDRCQHISELFNETVVKLHLIRRIKYYQLPCQRQDLNLSCFYDDIHLCLCQLHGKQLVANCFEFNHNLTFDCFGQSVCENNGQCFQDTLNCPQKSMCICQPCFYRRKCQFSTSGFSLSLDAILGYYIQPHIHLQQQPFIVQISIILSILFILVGLLNGIFALITFNNRIVCQVGCGLYLFGSSITTLITIIIFALKFWILILTQMEMIVNRSFILFQCHLIDFLLRIGINMDQWLNACVAVERAYTTIQGTRFDKKKSKQTAKIAIIILVIFVIGTNVHDPIYRRLIHEENEDEKRLWCIVSYSSQLQTYNSIMNIFHFIAPFILNFISVMIIIIRKSRQQSTVQNRRSYREILREQFRQHKHLFLAPIILIILAIPRLILSFISKCMKSSNDAWLFMMGYFISLIPPMLTFVVFVLPSKHYLKEYLTAMKRYRTNIRRCYNQFLARLSIQRLNRVHPTRT